MYELNIRMEWIYEELRINKLGDCRGNRNFS